MISIAFGESFCWTHAGVRAKAGWSREEDGGDMVAVFTDEMRSRDRETYSISKKIYRAPKCLLQPCVFRTCVDEGRGARVA